MHFYGSFVAVGFLFDEIQAHSMEIRQAEACAFI